MATTHRSDLVEQLEKALTDEAYDGGNGALSEEQFSKLVRTLATTAAEVYRELFDFELPEPSAEPTCEHGTMLTYQCADCPVPQGEPSDVPLLPDDCDCEDREALVRPEGLVCGTCDKVIAPAGAGGVR